MKTLFGSLLLVAAFAELVALYVLLSTSRQAPSSLGVITCSVLFVLSVLGALWCFRRP